MASRTKNGKIKNVLGNADKNSSNGKSKWYEDVDYYDDDEIEDFNQTSKMSEAKNSRHSLETEDEAERSEETSEEEMDEMDGSGVSKSANLDEERLGSNFFQTPSTSTHWDKRLN